MADQDLRIVLGFKIDQNKEKINLNKEIENLSKKLDKLKLNIEIDDKILNIFSQLSKSLNVVTNNLNKETSAVEEHTQAVKKAAQAEENWRKQRERSVKDGTGKEQYRVTTYGNDKFETQRVTSFPDGSIKGIVDDADLEKYRKEIDDLTNKMYEGRMKSEERIRDQNRKWNEDQQRWIQKNADLERKEIAKTQKARQDYENWWQDSVLQRDNKEQQIAIKEEERTKKAAQSYIEWWRKAIYEREQLENKQSTDLEKTHILALQQNQKREEDFLLSKAKTEAKIRDTQRRYEGDKNLQDPLNNLLGNLGSVSSLGNYKKALSEIDIELKKITASSATAGSNSISLGEAIGVAVQRFPIWVGVSTLVYGAAHAVSDLTQRVITLDDELVKMKRVMDEGTNFEAVLRQSISMADELGRKVSEVNAAIIEAAQAGFDAHQAMAITRTSVIGANVSDMKPEEMMSNLISAMTAFNIQANKSIDIVSKYNEVDNNFSTTTKDLALSVAKAGDAASVYGATLDDLIGYTTAVQTSTRETGKVIGDFEKILFSRLFSEQSTTALGQIGVATQELNGDNRKASEVISDLAKKWNFLSDTQKQNVGVAVVQREQLTRFLALFNNYDIAIKATNASLNSQGSAMRENAVYQQSLTAQLAKLDNSWTNFAHTLSDSGGKDALSGMITVATALMNAFAQLTEATDGWNIKLPLYAAGIYGLSKAFIVLSGAIKGVKSSLGVISLALMGIETLGTLMFASTKTVEANTQAFVDNASEIDGNKDRLQGLIDRYNALEPAAQGNIQKQEELHDVLNQIKDIAPQIINYTDDYGNALSLNKEKASAYIETLKEMTAEQLQQAKLASQIQVSDLSSKLEQAQDKLKQFSKTTVDTFNQISSYESLFGSQYAEKAKENFEKMIVDLQNKQKQFSDANDFAGASKIDQQIQELGAKFKEYLSLLTEGKQSLTDYSKLVNDSVDYKKQIKSLNEQGKSIEDQIAGREKLNDSVKQTTGYLDKDTGEWVSNANSVEKAGVSLQNLSAMFSKTYEAVQPLNDAIDRLKNGQQLSSDAISELIKKYPELISSISEENGMLNINVEGLTAVRDAKIGEMKTSIDAEQAKVDAQRQALSSRLTMYSDEIKAVKSLAEAQQLSLRMLQEADAQRHEAGESGPAYIPKGTVDQLEAIGKAQETIDALRKASGGANPFNFKNNINTPKEKKENNFVDKMFQNLPEYKEQVEDIQNQLKTVNDTIKDVQNSLQTAETTNDYTSQIENEQKLIDLLDERKNKYHEVAESMRETEKQMQSDFDKSFGAFRNGRSFADISKVEIQQYAESLDKQLNDIENQIGHSEEGVQKRSLEQSKEALNARKDLFQHFVSSFEEINKATQEQSDKWWDDDRKRLDEQDKLRQAYFDHSEQWIEAETVRLQLAGKDEIEIAQMVLDARKRMADEKWTHERNIAKLTADEQIEADKRVFEATQQLRAQYAKQVQDSFNKIVDAAKKAADNTIDSLSKALSAKESFDASELQSSVDTIINTLDELDKRFPGGFSFVDVTDSTRSKLQSYKADILSIARQVNEFGNYSTDNGTTLKSRIEEQIRFTEQLKNQITQINQLVRDTELGYKREESAIENQIQAQEKSYDAQIEAQRKVLENLDKQIEAEDRLAKLKEINDELEKVYNDKRFEFINSDGKVELRYNKERANELEKQRDELLKQYQRDDIKKALQDDIDRLEKNKNDALKQLRDRLDRTKAIHQQELETIRLYAANLNQLHQLTVQNTQSKIDQLKSIYDTDLSNLQSSFNSMMATAQNGGVNFNALMSQWQNSSLANLQGYVTNMGSEFSRLQGVINAMNSLRINPITVGSQYGYTTPAKGDPNSTPSGGGYGYTQPGKADGGSSTPSHSPTQEQFDSLPTPVVKPYGTYHTGKESGEIQALKSDEIPSIVKLSETVLTEMHQLRLENDLKTMLDINSRIPKIDISSIISAMLPKIDFSNIVLKNIATPQLAGPTYQFNNVTIKADSPTEFLNNINYLITSNRK